MADVLTEKQRHYNMSRIRSKNTKPEEVVRKYLFSKGFRYRKNDARYPGKPDIVLSKYKTVIFIHGCFWHQHPGCKAARIPDTNSEFWKSKFEKNIAKRRQNLILAFLIPILLHGTFDFILMIQYKWIIIVFIIYIIILATINLNKFNKYMLYSKKRFFDRLKHGKK